MAQEDEGWIEWKGGECCPIDLEKTPRIGIRFRSGQEFVSSSEGWEWTHLGENGDIIAYRVVKP